MKCDIVIPIYNQINWVKMCVKAAVENTKLNLIGKIYLIDDNSNEDTKKGLNELKNKYGEIIELITNKKNQGFVKNCNYAFDNTKSDYVLLLNSDCILSNNAVEKMMNAMSKDKKIGLLCPISSKAANISFPLVEGFTYQQINSLFEEQFSGKTFDACTVVGNCLMISRDCINKTGKFDEIFERGYSEETDYQFKAMAKGFKAKVLIDTYVFHEARISFGESEQQLDIRKKHLEIFFERWGKEYYALLEKYNQNDPIKYIKENIKYNKKSTYIKHIINKKINQEEIDILNNLIISNYNINIITKRSKKWMDFNTLFIPSRKRD